MNEIRFPKRDIIVGLCSLAVVIVLSTIFEFSLSAFAIGVIVALIMCDGFAILHRR